MKKKGVYYWLLALILVVALFSACGASADPPADLSASTSGGETDATFEARKLEDVSTASQDPFGKYDPPIEVKLIHQSNDGAFWFADGDSLDNNIYTRTWSEELGINYSFKWTSPGSQAEEKFNTMLAAGDLPDFISVDRKNFEKLYAGGHLADLTDAIIDYSSDYLRSRLTGDYADLLNIATKNGRYYGIGAGATYETGADMPWIRKDWLDSLGLIAPSTIADLEVILDAFKNANPSGKSPEESWPVTEIGADQQSYSWLMGTAYFNMFNSFPNSWYLNSKGVLEHGMFGEESRANTRAALEKAHEWYEKGYISPDLSATTYDMRTEMLTSGVSGVMFSNVWDSWWPLPLSLDNDPNADWLPIEPPTALAEKSKMSEMKVEIQGMLVARKGVQHPEALVKMSNLFMKYNEDPETMEFGKFNTDPVDSNQIFLYYPLVIHNPAFNMDAYRDIAMAQETGDDSHLCEAFKMFYDQGMAYANNKDISGWPSYRSYLKEGSSIGVVYGMEAAGRMAWNEFLGDPTQFMIDNEPTVKKLYDVMAIGVVTGELDIAEYDSFIAQWDSIYGNTATQEVNDWYKSK